MEGQNSKQYEISFLGKSEDIVREISDCLERHEARIISEASIKKINLSYKIKKENEAYFGYLYFECAPDKSKEIEKDLNLNTNILRFIIITPPFLKERKRFIPNESRSQSPTPTRPALEKRVQTQPSLTNEALEKKIEEILQ
jgi:ribosomal protein S6